MNDTSDNSIHQVERSPRGQLVVAGCTPATYLTRRVVAELNARQDVNHEAVPYLEGIDFRFSDSEIGVRLDMDVSGCDVFLFQTLYDPTSAHAVSEQYLALCIAARTFQEWGAHKITAMLPYLAYARQDKPTRFQREPTTARLMADLAITSGINRLVTWHPHYQQIHGFYSGVPVDVLEPLDFFVDMFRQYAGQDDVILVAPDVGTSKFVTHLGRALDLHVAIAAKYHPEHEQTEISQIIGDLAHKRTALIVDDMMSSGGTVYEVVRKLVEEFTIEKVLLGVSHNLCTDKAYDRLLDMRENYHLEALYVTNSIPQTQAFRELPFVKVHDLTGALVNTIKRIHYNRS